MIGQLPDVGRSLGEDIGIFGVGGARETGTIRLPGQVTDSRQQQEGHATPQTAASYEANETPCFRGKPRPRDRTFLLGVRLTAILPPWVSCRLELKTLEHNRGADSGQQNGPDPELKQTPGRFVRDQTVYGGHGDGVAG